MSFCNQEVDRNFGGDKITISWPKFTRDFVALAMSCEYSTVHVSIACIDR